MRPASLRVQFSSGGVIFKRQEGKASVALISVKGGQVWGLPKGLVNKGETPEETALREVEEETGLKGILIEKIGQITYWYFLKEENAKYKKTVDFFLMKYIEGNVKDHDFEVDEVRWFPLDEAMEKLTYKGDKEILLKAKAMMENMEGHDNP